MVKAFLIDDEKKIIALMEKLVDWEALGIEIIGSANSGQKGLAAILELHPDIVVTDIRMPGIDGLEMIRQVRAKGLKVHFILISGHKHFEYAQSAIKYGVENYLLKPINRQELTDNLKSVRDKVLEDQISMSEKVSLQNQMRIASDKMRRQFMNKIIRKESFDSLSLDALNQEYMLHLETGYFQILITKADLLMHLEKEQVTIANQKLLAALNNELQKYCVETIAVNDQGWIVFLINYHAGDVREKLVSVLNELHYQFKEYCDISIGASKIFSKEWPFSLMYEQALESIYDRIYLGTNRIIAYGEVQRENKAALSQELLEELSKAVEVRDRSQLSLLFRSYESSLMTCKPSRNVFFSELSIIYEMLQRVFYNKDNQFQLSVDREQFVEMFRELPNLRRIREVLFMYVSSVMDDYETQLNQADHRVIRQAKEYISRHYAENISLETLAGETFMNPVYFSVLFKKEEGTNFSDYLINYRIEKAKELLKNETYSILEVGCMVGYKNARYFSKLFQKTVGIKPSEFRKLYL